MSVHGRDGFLTAAERDKPYILLNLVALVQKKLFSKYSKRRLTHNQPPSQAEA